MTKTYLASGWFNPTQKETMDKVRNLLIDMGFEVYAPYYDGIQLSKDDSPINRLKVFQENIKSITLAKLMIACIDNFEPGTIWEFGFAYGVSVSWFPEIDIIAYTDVPGRGLNVMLQQATCQKKGFAAGLEQLKDQLTRYKNSQELADYYPFVKGKIQ